jgi:hypothetical protein
MRLLIFGSKNKYGVDNVIRGVSGKTSCLTAIIVSRSSSAVHLAA